MEIPGFTRHPTGGWVRSYKGKTVWCGGRNASREEVEDTFHRRRQEIDAEIRQPASPDLYRDVLSAFMSAMRIRKDTGKPRPLAKRTFHNYDVELNRFGAFVGGGVPFSQTNDPKIFAAYAAKFSKWKSSGYDSIVSRVSSLYRWAEGMEYIDRFRPGPQFQRPDKSEIRDERIDLSKTFEPGEFAKLYAKANGTMRCWLGLGLFCAMTNSEVSHLTRSVIADGLIDFRRRKKGKARRLCPMPALLLADIAAYQRPDASHDDDSDILFLSVGGHRYSGTRHRDGKPSDMISRLFRELMIDAGVPLKRGRNFTGLRTTFFNLFTTMPRRGDYDLERRIIMGRAHGTVDLDSYLEEVGVDRLCHVVTHIWSSVSTALRDQGAVVSPEPFPASPVSSPADTAR